MKRSRRDVGCSIAPHPLLLLAFAMGCGGARAAGAGATEAIMSARVTSEPSYEVVEEAVTFDAAGRSVHGTLSRPLDEGRHPALLVIAGSGPTDRDWNSPLLPGTNGSGRLLARALSARGLVVLRYDKLGTGLTARPATPVSWGDYVAEQRAALALLSAHDAVDPAQVYLGGHSEGGAHAIHLAADPGVPLAGLVLLAAPGRSFLEVMLGQLEGQFRAAGVEGADLAAQMDPLRSGFERLIAGETVAPTEVSQIPPVQALFAACAAPAGLPFARELLPFEPVAALARLTLPVLVLNGERDIQVSPTLDATALADGARAAGNPDVTLVLVPEANHVLRHEPTPLGSLDPSSVAAGYSSADTDLDPDALAQLVRWLGAHDS